MHRLSLFFSFLVAALSILPIMIYLLSVSVVPQHHDKRSNSIRLPPLYQPQREHPNTRLYPPRFFFPSSGPENPIVA